MPMPPLYKRHFRLNRRGVKLKPVRASGFSRPSAFARSPSRVPASGLPCGCCGQPGNLIHPRSPRAPRATLSPSAALRPRRNSILARGTQSYPLFKHIPCPGGSRGATETVYFTTNTDRDSRRVQRLKIARFCKLTRHGVSLPRRDPQRKRKRAGDRSPAQNFHQRLCRRAYAAALLRAASFQRMPATAASAIPRRATVEPPSGVFVVGVRITPVAVKVSVT